MAVSEGAEVSGLRPWAAWAGSMDDEIVGAAGAAGSTLTELGTLFSKQDGVVAHVSFLRFSGPASVSAE